MKAGLPVVADGWMIFNAARPITSLARSGRIIVSTYVIAPALVALVLAGPLSLLEFLPDHFGDW